VHPLEFIQAQRIAYMRQIERLPSRMPREPAASASSAICARVGICAWDNGALASTSKQAFAAHLRQERIASP